MKPMGERAGSRFTRETKPGRYLYGRGDYGYKATMTEKKRIRRRVKRTGKQDMKREIQQSHEECDQT